MKNISQSNSSHHNRARLAKLALMRGYAVDRDLTKTFRNVK